MLEAKGPEDWGGCADWVGGGIRDEESHTSVNWMEVGQVEAKGRKLCLLTSSAYQAAKELPLASAT